MNYPALSLAAALLLGGCGSGEGTDISIEANRANADGVAVTADGKTGNVAVKVPGFSANVTMPKIMLDAGNFDIDGVKLFPESRVRSLNIVADDGSGGDSATVQVKFDAPAPPAEVQDWFIRAFSDRAISATADGEGVKGMTKDGEPFTIRIAPSGENASEGTIEIRA